MVVVDTRGRHVAVVYRLQTIISVSGVRDQKPDRHFEYGNYYTKRVNPQNGKILHPSVLFRDSGTNDRNTRQSFKTGSMVSLGRQWQYSIVIHSL